MTMSPAYDAASVQDAMLHMEADTPIIDRIRQGRRDALAGLKARRAEASNVVTLFNGEAVQSRNPKPVFHSRRSDAQTVQQVQVTSRGDSHDDHQMEPLLLTNPVAA